MKINIFENFKKNAKSGVSTCIAFIKRTISAFNHHNGLIVAIATIALVWVTYRHIDEAKSMRSATEKMAIETKSMALETQRLANLNEEQFKIRAYPSFVITDRSYSLESDKIIQKFQISNRGEITAFNVKALIINASKRNESGALTFNEQWNAFYTIGEDKITSIDFETKIPGNIGYTITTERNYIPAFQINHPIHTLIFVRFKVPYDENFRYETHFPRVENPIFCDLFF